MYIDRTVLKIIFHNPDEKQLDSIVDHYQQSLSEIHIAIIDKILSDPDILKPKVKGLQRLTTVMREIVDTKKFDEAKLNEAMVDAIKVVIKMPVYEILLMKNITKFSENLIQSRVAKMHKSEIKDLKEYLDNLDKKVLTYKQIFSEIKEDLLKEYNKKNNK